MASCAGFSRYPRAEHSCENFPKQKWHEAKKQFLFIYMEPFLSIPRPQNNLIIIIFFSDTVGHKLNQGQAQMLSDTGHTVEAGGRDAQWGWGKELSGSCVAAWGGGEGTLPLKHSLQNRHQSLFSLFASFHKSKSPFCI